MTDQTSTWESFLRELAPVPMLPPQPGSFIDIVLRDLAEQHAADEAWLASLTDHDRRVELTRRRIVALEARFRAALDFTPCNCRDDL